MSGNILIPGGEISMSPVNSYIGKDGKTHPSPARVWVAFGKNSMAFRTDQLRELVTAISNTPEIRDFIGLSE